MDFVTVVMGSPWGWKYFLAIVLVGSTVSRNGAMWCIAVTMGGLGWLINVDPSAVYHPAHALASGPITAMQWYLLNPPWHWSPGGAAVLLGMGLGACMLPVATANVKFAIQSRLVSSFTDETNMGYAAYLYLLNRVSGGPIEMIRCMARIIIVNVVWLSMTVCLWLALARLGDQGYILSFTRLGLTDIILPHFTPVWDMRYLVAPVFLYMMQTLYARDIEDSGGCIIHLSRRTAVVMRVIAFTAVACLLPAGISLFLVGYSLLTLPSSWVGRTEVAWEILDREDELKDDEVQPSHGSVDTSYQV